MASLDQLLSDLSRARYAAVVELAALPGRVRGYEDVKLGNVDDYNRRRERLLSALAQPLSRPKSSGPCRLSNPPRTTGAPTDSVGRLLSESAIRRLALDYADAFLLRDEQKTLSLWARALTRRRRRRCAPNGGHPSFGAGIGE